MKYIKIITIVFWAYIFLGMGTVNAASSNDLKQTFKTGTMTLITERVQEHHTFYGLAFYYNEVLYYLVDNDKIEMIKEDEEITMQPSQWLAAVGRFNVLLVKAPGLKVHLTDRKLEIDDAGALDNPDALVKLTMKPELASIAPELDQIRYAHLWGPFAWLAKGIEAILVAIQRHIASNWGVVIIIFSLLIKLLLFPVGRMTSRIQESVSKAQSTLAPKLAEIKANYDGEEAHNRLMAAHKEVGVSPFYTLKPMLGTFIQVPFWIAAFNALGEMPQLVGQSFLWINDLAYPDAIAQLPFTIPMFGNTVNLLPFIMTVVTIYSTLIFQDKYALAADSQRQKRKLYWMALIFFILFYPFPAAMVLYWTLNNILHTVQQQVVKD